MASRALARAPLPAAILVCLAAVGCDLVAGLDAVRFEGDGGEGGTTGTGAAGAAGGGGIGGAGGATGTGGEPGGSGGAPTTTTSTGSVCGNGMVETGEACDDGNAVEGDGCHECQPDCGCAGCVAGSGCADCPAAGQATFKDVGTKHCYVASQSATTWPAARTSCMALGAGWDLAAPSTAAEMTSLMAAPGMPIDDHLNSNPNNRFWTGGTDQALEGTFVWSNGETWNDPPIGMTLESVIPAEDCLVIGLTAGVATLRARVCDTDMYQILCEHTP